MQLRLSNDRTEVDMHLLATAFGLSRNALDDALSLGTISYCYELGPGDTATPRTVFRSTETGQRIALDRIGRILPSEGTLSADQPLPCSEACRRDGATPRVAHAATPGDTTQASGPPQKVAARRLDELLDEALRDSFPASDPIAISFDVQHRGN